MKCNHCGADINPGATFCGNCGQPLAPVAVQSATPYATAPSPVQPTAFASNINPAGYAQPVTPTAYNPMIAGNGGMVAVPLAPGYNQYANTAKNTKAIIAMVLGILGLVGWLIPIVGCVLGITAIILGTMSLRQPHRAFAIAGIVLAVPVLGLSIFVWVKGVQTVTNAQKTGVALPSNAKSASGAIIDTLCYKTDLGSDFTITQGSDSCTTKAANLAGTDVYNLKGIVSPYKASELESISQQDIKTTLSAFAGATITSQKSVNFAGSAAFAYTFSIPDAGETGLAEYIRHESVNGINTFVIVRESSGGDVSLKTLEDSWIWKK